MKNLVIITSYIKTQSLSVFTWQERLGDIERSISSVKSNIPDAYIVLAEGSEITLDELSSLNVDYIYTKPNKFLKSTGELTLLLGYLTSDHFNSHEFETISKLSGRYTFTELFDFSKFPLDSFIIKSRDSCIFETRYYRFNADSLAYFLDMVKKSFHDMTKLDIEHAFYKNCNFPKDKIFHPEHIGVVGILAPNGQIVED